MIKVGILTCSDKGSRGERIDESGKLIKDMLKKIGGEVFFYEVVPDDKDIISQKLRLMADRFKLDLVLTTGGTGFSKRDVTPEATKSVIKKDVPGIPEFMRFKGLKNSPRAILSRAVAGIRGNTLIINLPGSPKGVRESLGAVLDVIPHGIEIIKGEAKECG